jgi:methylthioribose-1-phosphate isomerase
MKINNISYQTIWINKNDSQIVNYIDQRYLPYKFVIGELRTVQDVGTAISDMHLRGAPLIGVAAAFGMYLAALQYNNQSEIKNWINDAAQLLLSTRPTAVNLQTAINRQLQRLSDTGNKEIPNILLTGARQLWDEEFQNCKHIGEQGLPVIEKLSRKKPEKVVNILTHCNAGWLACIDFGTATAPIYIAHDKGIKVHVWVDETRPRNQGARLTAWELGQHGVPHTIIADNTGGHLMQHGMVDMVIVGSDRTTRKGDAANKIGTYLKALAAKDNNIPFYVAVPSSSIDWNIEDAIREIPIEERDAGEVHSIEGYHDGSLVKVRLTPESSHAVNYGFDVTPARLITGLITERGLCPASREGLMSIFPEKY